MRPKNYKNPYNPMNSMLEKLLYDTGEAAADAMLEALREIGFYGQHGELIEMGYAALHLTDKHPEYSFTTGWLVFIPEEDKDATTN